MSEGGKAALEANDQMVGASEVRALKKRVREWERLLGKKTTARVAFPTDCCDREVIGFLASMRGISSEMIQDMMLECVEKRFRTGRALRPVQWLSDNGPCFAARETVKFAAWLSLESRFTPVRSPESNGMAEAFVKTFKRDYVHVQDRPNSRQCSTNWRAGLKTTTRGIPTRACGEISPQVHPLIGNSRVSDLAGGYTSNQTQKTTPHRNIRRTRGREASSEGPLPSMNKTGGMPVHCL